MKTIHLKLPDALARKLAARAKERGVSPEAFLRLVAEEVVARPDEELESAIDHVLAKNQELYDRLAR